MLRFFKPIYIFAREPVAITREDDLRFLIARRTSLDLNIKVPATMILAPASDAIAAVSISIPPSTPMSSSGHRFLKARTFNGI